MLNTYYLPLTSDFGASFISRAENPRMKTAVVTLDVEPDYPPDLGDSRLGVDKALPRLLDLFKSEDVAVSIFFLADLCRFYPTLPKEIAAQGFHVGNHGVRHRLFCLEEMTTQWRDIRESTRILREVLGRGTTTFRAPNFSANGDTLQCLEKAGYHIDSSVLPGRRMKRGLFGRVYDFRGAPTSPYHASIADIRKHGASSVLEMPAAANPETKQTPMGGGFINVNGAARAFEIMKTVEVDPAILVFHPWEFVDLSESFPNLPAWTRKSCREDFESLREFIGRLKDGGWRFASLETAADEYERLKS